MLRTFFLPTKTFANSVAFGMYLLFVQVTEKIFINADEVENEIRVGQ